MGLTHSPTHHRLRLHPHFELLGFSGSLPLPNSMKFFKHLLLFSSNRSIFTKALKPHTSLPSHSSLIHQNAITTNSPLQNPKSILKTPIFLNPKSPISLLTRKTHSLQALSTDEDSDDVEEDAPMTEFLSRFVWIMRGKLADAYPDVDKQSINGMLLIIVEKVVEELDKGRGTGEMVGSAGADGDDDFSEDLWKTVWEVSNSVFDDMKKARKKEEMKKYIQSEEVKEMCKFASEVGVRGNMLREFRFKWAKEKMEEVEFYQSLERLRDEARVEEREEVEEGEVQIEEVVGEGGNVAVKPKVTSLPQRRGKIKYRIYGLDLSDKKWAEVADRIHENERIYVPEEPKLISGKCKLVNEKILNLSEEDDPSALLAEWVELLDPSRVDWCVLLDSLKEWNQGLYLKVAEIALDEDSFQANIRDYSKLIDAHAKDYRIEDAERVLKKMSEKGIQPDGLASIILLHMYSKAGNLDRAKEAFAGLRSQGFQLDMRAYNSMIMAYVNAGKPKEAQELAREMEVRDIKPTKEIYVALLKSFSELGYVREVQQITTTMQYVGFHPSLESCTLLVEAYAKAGNPDNARTNLDIMRKIGHMPDDSCTASLVSVYEKRNSLDKALDLLLQLETDGFQPGVCTYAVLVDWFAKLQLNEEAEQILKKIVENGLTLPLKVQVSLCEMYLKSKDEKKALQALGILEGKKDLLGEDDFQRIIKGFVDCGLVQEACRVRRMMEARGFSLSAALSIKLTANSFASQRRPVSR